MFPVLQLKQTAAPEVAYEPALQLLQLEAPVVGW
jgi:hypothetical protein